jgi:hypothetical protein
MKTFKFKWLLLSIILSIASINTAWANNYIEGDAGLIATGWNKTGTRIDNSPYTNYAIAAGKYWFKVTDGNNESGSSCFGTVTGISSSNYGTTDGCMWINLSGINDVTFTWANSGWNVNISVTTSSYFIKYPWGDNHAWTFSAPMTACGDGTYACTGPYNGTTYDFGRRGYDGGAGALTAQTATVNNSPATDENCVFNVTTAGALTITRCNKVTATNKIYFDNSVSNFTGNIYLIIGHDKPTKYSCAYKMTQLAGTKLHYVSIDANWTDATYYAIVGNTAASISAGSWGSGDLSSKQTGGYSAAYTGKYDLAGSNKQYLFTTSSSGNNKALTITYKNTGYSNLNYAQTVTLCTKAYGADTYSANTSSLTSLNFTTYNLTAVGTVSTQQTNNINGSTGVASGNACQAATTTINVGDAPASWIYDGIYTGMNSGSQVSDDQEFTYYPTAATNYYVRFHEVHDPSVSVSASSAYLTTTSGLRALTDEAITLTATATYTAGSPVRYTYEYSTNGGSTWNSIASSVTNTTQTYTPTSTGDYKFRVTLPNETGTPSAITNVHVTEMYRIKVKKNSSWTPNKLYVWNKSSEITQYGAFPGSTGKFTNHGQWYEFDLNSDFDSFIVSASDHNSNRTADKNSVTSDGCYSIGGTTGTSCPVSSATCPSAPTLSTSDAGTIRETSAVLGGNVSNIGNDPVTERGYYWSTNSALSSSNLGVGTKVVVSSASTTSTGAFSTTKSSLSVNTKYYFIAYATNAYGTSYGTVKNFTTLNTYSVTVAAGSGGEVNTTSVTAGQYQSSTTITATPSTNYAFVNWTASTANITIASATSKSTTVKATSTGTVTANFADQWNVKGNQWDNWNTYNGMPNVSSNTFRKSFSLPRKTTYNFKIVKRADAGGSDVWYGVDGGKTLTRASNSVTGLEANGGENEYITFTTDAAGTYTITYVYNASAGSMSVTVGYPTAYQITTGQKTVYDPNVSNTSDATTTGGNVTAVDNSSNTIINGDYVVPAANVTFTAHPATGYAFKGWYSDAACETAYIDNSATTNTVVIDEEAKTLTLNNIGTNKAVYAKYEEIMTSVDVETYGRGTLKIDNGAATSGTDGSTVPFVQVGVKTTHKVTIVSENAGYYFAGWELSPGSSCEEAGKGVNFKISGTASSEDNRTDVTITGLGDPDKCTTLNFLRADFKFLEQIYFRNVFDDGTTPATHWSNVYVFFDVSWNGSAHCAVTSANNSDYGLHVQMEAIGSTGIYRAYIPRYATRNNKTKVAFADYDVSSNSANFNPGSGTHHGSYRSDYSNLHNMFVPNHVKEANDGYYTSYYNKGYWMHYTITEGVNAGYWIEERTGTNTYSGKPAEQFVVLNRAFETNPQIRYRLRIDGTSDKNYAIFSEGGVKYKASSTIKYNTCENISLTEDNGSDAYFTIKPTAEGEYILTIDQSGDVMKLSVEYPVVAGDYVIENAFNDGSAKTTRSNVIKSAQAGTKTRYSMYLNNASSGTLKLRKCNGFDGSGNPIWTSGDDTNLQTILNDAKFTKGVYQFDITIADDKVSDVDSLRLYTGNFYIKTDAASGGWVTYKNNILDKNTVNFDRDDPDTYDHYFCKYFESKDCNIKSVIANDYCNQLSDTVKGDDIARMVAGEPYVPVDGTSIRFSYNSATNETKRAYLGASKTADFLNIEPYSASKIYKTDGTSDLYGASASDRKFSDQGDWVYEMDLKVVPGGQAGVSASYTDAQTPTPVKHVQTLIANDNIVLGGSGSNKYDIRVVYDFKTNYMMSSFVLSDTIKDALEDVDLLWVRHRDRSPQQLSLKGEGKLENVSVVAAIELRYDSVHMSGSGTDHVDTRAWNELTRPYLKYFVSFPFDVPVNSIFGLNQAELGREYVIQHYNGAKRAKEGLFGGDGDNYWEYLTKDSIMHANEGYCVIFDNDYVSGLSGHIWDNKTHGSSVYLYFPANSIISNITNDNATTKVDTLWCHINRTWVGSDKNHQNTDSHWHMIGSPLFHDSYIKDTTGSAPYNLSSFYYLGWDNRWYAKAVKDERRFKAMSSRMVQWYGTITWSIDAEQSIYAPRRVNAPQKNYFAKIELSNNNKVADWTYVQLQNGADDNFVLREDMYKMYNSGIPQIYTFAGAYDVAYNGVPEKSQTIPVGVLIRKNGTYTFSMPTTFSGTVTLIDTFEQTRTDLSITDYTVELEKGTINDRFLLEINIESVVTSLENENGNNVLNDGGVHKFIKDDNMYILRNGVIYDAQGRKVK